MTSVEGRETTPPQTPYEKLRTLFQEGESDRKIELGDLQIHLWDVDREWPRSIFGSVTHKGEKNGTPIVETEELYVDEDGAFEIPDELDSLTGSELHASHDERVEKTVNWLLERAEEEQSRKNWETLQRDMEKRYGSKKKRGFLSSLFHRD